MSLSQQGGGGGAKREAGLETLEKQLTCPICLELLQKPVVILPCQHNLCRKCANHLYQPRTTMAVNSGRFRCPSCRHEVILDRHGVFGLQRNLLVENIIDIYKQEVDADAGRPVAVTPSLPVEVTCSEHHGEKVNIYCVTCQLPTCSLCKVFGQHQSCQVQPLDHVLQNKKEELREGVSALLEVNHKVQALIEQLDHTCRSMEESAKTQKQNVCDKFSRMFSILDERRKAMMERISSEEEETTGHAQLLACCYGDSIEANRKLVETVRSSMEDLDMAAFVQISKELIAKVQAAASFKPAETPPGGQDKMRRYTFDFSRQERAARSVDFVPGRLLVADASPASEHLASQPEVEPDREPFLPHSEPSLALLDVLNPDDGEEEVPGPPAEPEQAEDAEGRDLAQRGSAPMVDMLGGPINTQQREEGGAVSQAGDWTEGRKEAGPGDILLYRSGMKPPPGSGDAEEITDDSQPRPLCPRLLPPSECHQSAEVGQDDKGDAQGWACPPDEGADQTLRPEKEKLSDASPMEEEEVEEEEEEEGEVEEEEGGQQTNRLHKVEACDEEEGVASFDSLQAVTVLFYLLAFLLLLQKLWSYVGCFICT
ncbi:tripartite motif-containing protein 54-like isoform X2 [Nerophis ophidion]|uniref:tripartite motif-containing protein 54-like isoform X2 n=1 Tax=Nerophis ophidion TaxID=159077 RepID=UPI002ADF12CB|nr:tripartite motif-containing protein 54-like isoform X2 [Nerophis ophidion]